MEDFTGIDMEWLTGLSEGEESAFRRLFSHYHDFIYSFARRMTGSDAIAQDVVQEVFIKLWLHRGELPGIRNLGAYINRLTRNHVLNGMKRMAHESLLLEGLQPQLSASPAATDARAEVRDLEMLLDEALRQLPGQQQRVYRMSRMEGLKHEEIAGILGISRETVKKHMMAALPAIRNFLREHHEIQALIAFCLIEWFS